MSPAQILSIGITLVDVHLSWLIWFHFLILVRSLLFILIACMIFLTITRCFKDVYVSSVIPQTARLWNSLPIGLFPLTYDLDGFKFRINRYLLIADLIEISCVI